MKEQFKDLKKQSIPLMLVCELFRHALLIVLGGIAGGDKFTREGIFFKFNLDNHGLYGGTTNAAKSAYHELRSFDLIAGPTTSGFLPADLEGKGDRHLRFPLFAIVDYRGYQISCLSLLPIDKQTHIYGSSDGGINFTAKHFR